MKSKLLIVDDEARVRRVLTDFFKANGFEVLTAGDGEEALEVYYANNNKVDLILLDVMMPKIDGIEVLNRIRQDSLVPVIMLTAKGEEHDLLLGFGTGADDYVSKPFSPTILLARVHSVLKRTYARDKLEALGKIKINNSKREVVIEKETISLTFKEYDLLIYLAINQCIALTRQNILDCVWGYDYEGDLRTVDTHVKQLRAKLGGCGSYIITVRGIGYRFEVHDD